MFYNFNLKHFNLISHLSTLFHMMILQSSPLMINKLHRNILVEDIIRDAQLQQGSQLHTLTTQIFNKLPLILVVVGIINKLIWNFIIIMLLALSLRICLFFMLWDEKYYWFTYPGLYFNFYGQFIQKFSSIYDLFSISAYKVKLPTLRKMAWHHQKVNNWNKTRWCCGD